MRVAIGVFGGGVWGWVQGGGYGGGGEVFLWKAREKGKGVGGGVGTGKSGARGPPQFLKKRSENAGANENLSGGFAAISGIAPRVAPRIVGFVLIKS